MIILIGLLEIFRANHKAIIQSTKLSTRKKNTLLTNLLIDIELVFFEIGAKDKFIIE